MSDLSALAIGAALDRLGARVGRPLSVADVTESTNDDARAAAAAGAPDGAAFVADQQTRGRGRGQHVWHSPPGQNIYLSLLLRPRVTPQGLGGVTLAIGVAIARLVEAAVLERAPVWVKWPNDVLAGPDKKKLAGVLVWGHFRGTEVTSVVAGVGVNVHATAFPPAIAERATSLALLGAEGLDQSVIAARLLAAIGDAVARFEVDRLASFTDDLARLDALRGREVEIAELRGSVRGTAEGIDEEGRLLLREGGALTPIVSGEVMIR